MFSTIKPIRARAALLAAASLATLSLVTLAGATAQPAATGDMVLQGGTLIDGTGKAPVTDAVIVTKAGRITAVGKRGQVQIPTGANVVDVTGKTILPGLMDIHLHTVDWQIPMFLHYGVTTVADQNNDTTWIMAEREALKAGKMQGPRMYVGGSSTDGTQVWPVRPVLDNGFNYPAVKNPIEATAYAKHMVALGVDIVKIHSNLTDDELRAVIQVGKDAGLPVMGHTQNIRRAAEMGIKFDEHMWTVAFALLDPADKTHIGQGSNDDPPPEALMDPKTFPPLVDYMVQQGVYVNPPMLGNWAQSSPQARSIQADGIKLAKDPELTFVPEDVKKVWTTIPPKRAGYDNVITFLKEFAQKGGKVVVGTDTGFDPTRIPGLAVHQEMRQFLNAGYTPMQVIQSATLWPAQLIKKDKDVGSVEVGKYADFVVIDGDPLKNIDATRNIRMVIQGGKVMNTKYDPHWTNPIPGTFLTWEGQVPTITVTPNGAAMGDKPVTLTIDEDTKHLRGGIYAAFGAHDVVRFDNVDLPTKLVSGTRLTATLDPKALPKIPGSYPLYVVKPGVRGWVSKATYLSVGGGPDKSIAGYAVVDGHVLLQPTFSDAVAPTITPFYGPEPRSARQGAGGVTLTIDGTSFTPASVVRTDNAQLPTTFVSPTRLTAKLDASFMQRAPGGYVIYVLNPGPMGGITKPGYFLVDLKK